MVDDCVAGVAAGGVVRGPLLSDDDAEPCPESVAARVDALCDAVGFATSLPGAAVVGRGWTGPRRVLEAL